MSVSVKPLVVARVGNSGDSAVRPLWQSLQIAVERSGIKHEALAAHMGIHPSYLSKLLWNTKPLGARYIDALPKVVRLQLATLLAEDDGLLVMPQPTRDEANGLVLLALEGLKRATVSDGGRA